MCTGTLFDSSVPLKCPYSHVSLFRSCAQWNTSIMQVCSSPSEFRSQESALFKKARAIIAKSHVPYPFDKLSLASHSSARLQYHLAAMGCQGANNKPSRKIFASFAQAAPTSWAGRDASGDWTPLPLVR